MEKLVIKLRKSDSFSPIFSFKFGDMDQRGRHRISFGLPPDSRCCHCCLKYTPKQAAHTLWKSALTHTRDPQTHSLAERQTPRSTLPKHFQSLLARPSAHAHTYVMRFGQSRSLLLLLRVKSRSPFITWIDYLSVFPETSPHPSPGPIPLLHAVKALHYFAAWRSMSDFIVTLRGAWLFD